MVGAQDLFFASRIVGDGARISNEAAPPGSAAVTLGLPFLVYPCRMVLLLWQWWQFGVWIVSSFYPDSTSGTTTNFCTNR